MRRLRIITKDVAFHALALMNHEVVSLDPTLRDPPPYIDAVALEVAGRQVAPLYPHHAQLDRLHLPLRDPHRSRNTCPELVDFAVWNPARLGHVRLAEPTNTTEVLHGVARI